MVWEYWDATHGLSFEAKDWDKENGKTPKVEWVEGSDQAGHYRLRFPVHVRLGLEVTEALRKAEEVLLLTGYISHTTPLELVEQ